MVRLVDPGELRLPPSRELVDPFKLAAQFAKFSTTLTGMPPIEVVEDVNGVMRIQDGVTRATRVYRFCPIGTLVPVIVQVPSRRNLATRPKAKDQS
jgi:hypothetical protein